MVVVDAAADDDAATAATKAGVVAGVAGVARARERTLRVAAVTVAAREHGALVQV